MGHLEFFLQASTSFWMLTETAEKCTTGSGAEIEYGFNQQWFFYNMILFDLHFLNKCCMLLIGSTSVSRGT